MGLPQSSNPVLIEDDVVADDREVLRLRLSDQHAIEWIFVWSWQEACSNAVC